MLSLIRKSIPQKKEQVAVWITESMVVVAEIKGQSQQLKALGTCEVFMADDKHRQQAFLKKICKERELDRHKCIGLMSSKDYELIMVEAPDVPHSELREAIRWKVKDMIGFPVNDAVIDVFDIPDHKNTGDMVYVVIAKSEDIRMKVEMISDAGFELNSIDIMELSMRNLAHLNDADQGGAALIKLGRERGSITLSKQNILYFTRHLSNTRPLFEQYYAPSLTSEMEGWLDTIVIEVQRSLDYYESNYKQSPVNQILLVPFIKPITGVQDYLSSQLGIEVNYLDLNKLLDVKNPLGVEKMSICSTAIGAALREVAA